MSSIGLRGCRISLIDSVIVILLVVYIVLYSILLLRTNINWDEFTFLEKVFNFQMGRPVSLTQTFHVHLFGWITELGGHEIKKILSARVVQLCVLLLSVGLVYLISRILFDRTSSLLTAFLVLSYTDIIRHGTSFRYDPLCLFFSLLSILLYLRSKTQISAFMSGLPLAVSFLISIKSVFFLVSIAFLFALRVWQVKPASYEVKRFVVFLAGLSIFGAMLFVFHSWSTSLDSEGGLEQGRAVVGQVAGAGSKMFLQEGWFPRQRYILRSISENPGHWLLLALSILYLFSRMFDSHRRENYLALFAFVLPLTSLAVYRNAYPYFFVYVIPPAMILTGVVTSCSNKEHKSAQCGFQSTVILLSLFLTLSSSVRFLALRFEDGIRLQREIVELVHEIFPSPVPYIDAHGMISSFPKVGFFMSTWGLDTYRATGRPIMRKALEKEQPRFILANRPALDIRDSESLPQKETRYRLLDADHAILAENFVPHWGPIYLAGKQFRGLTGNGPVGFEILIAGKYTLEASTMMKINGQDVRPGGVIDLPQGQHTIESISADTALLRWGNHIERPSRPGFLGGIYFGF